MDYNDLATFVRVVRTGGIGAASRELDVPKSTVSRAITRLEGALGVALLERSARRAFPTQEGGRLYERCARLFATADEAVRDLDESEAQPKGVLRLVAKRDYEGLLVPVLSAYAGRHPAVRVEAGFTNRRVDVFEEGFDLAITTHADAQPDVVVRPLGALRQTLCASPAYLAREGAPAAPAALAAHALAGCGPTTDLRLGASHVAVSTRFDVGSASVERALALDGHCVALLPDWLVAPDLAAGRLVAVLPGHAAAAEEPYVLAARSRLASARVRAFLAVLEAHLVASPGWSPTPGSPGSTV